MKSGQYTGELRNVVVFYGSALAFFLILNVLRFIFSWGAGGITLFQADYSLPPVAFWLAHRLGMKRWTAIIILFATVLLVLTIDAVSVAGRQFQWGPDAILPYLNASSDLPWRLITPVAGAVLLTAILSTIGLVWCGKSSFALWPLILFMLISIIIDSRFGNSRFRDSRGDVNVVTTAIVDLGPLYVGSLIRGGSLRRVAGGTMATALSQKVAPPEILSVAVESFGLAKDSRQRAALIAPLLSELRSEYDIVQTSHPFFGSTLQGEVRELCGVRLVGNANDPRVKRRLGMCLPHILSRRGYDTEALHGNGGQIYARKNIYPAMGFKRSWFYSDLRAANQNIQPCSGVLFDGACDIMVYKQAISLFNGHRRFVHIMSLDSHLPIPDSTPRICPPSFAENDGFCRYAFLIRRSLGNIGALLRRAHNKPDIIFIYGDHSPPFLSKKLRDMFSREEVPFVVLKKRMM